jgi:DNA-binding CsgD family transcriptional regulator/tetratricopeptide (TPR) repeat protein
MALGLLGLSLAYRGDYTRASTAAEESITILRDVGDLWTLGIALAWHAEVDSWRGDDVTARTSLEESIAVHRRIGEHWLIASPLARLGDIAFRQGDYATAQRYCEESVALWHQAGSLGGAPHAFSSLGLVAVRRGNYHHAERCFSECLTLSREAGRPMEIPPALIGLASVALARTDAERAAHLLGAAQALCESLGVSVESFFKVEFERATATARAQMGEAALAPALAAGQLMDQAQALDYALSPATHISRHSTPHGGAEPKIGKAPAVTRDDDLAQLTRREIEVLGRLAAGDTSKEIAAQLGIAVPTVDRHIANIYTKIGARGRADATAFALRHSLLDD